MAVHMRYKSLCISQLFSVKSPGREMITSFEHFEKT